MMARWTKLGKAERKEKEQNQKLRTMEAAEDEKEETSAPGEDAR